MSEWNMHVLRLRVRGQYERAETAERYLYGHMGCTMMTVVCCTTTHPFILLSFFQQIMIYVELLHMVLVSSPLPFCLY